MTNLLAVDLEHILVHTEGLWDELRGSRLFITGGTGFFGCWLLESLQWANERLALDARAVVLTRDPGAFARKAPQLAEAPAVQLCQGDVGSFDFPPGEFSHIIHAATDASVTLNRDQPERMLDTVVAGTRRVLAFARACGARKFLLTSSGAIYGPQPPDLTHVPEAYSGGPDSTDPRSAYAEGKRLAELLGVIEGQQQGLAVKIARCFAFVGPYLPLATHFAIGNFIGDGLAGRPIRVNGDGTPYRSYLYAADLAAWLWTILCRGTAGRPYNVGSEEQLCIAELAARVAGAFSPPPEVRVMQPASTAAPPPRYVPDTARARTELGLRQTIDLDQAIAKTIQWHNQTAAQPLIPER